MPGWKVRQLLSGLVSLKHLLPARQGKATQQRNRLVCRARVYDHHMNESFEAVANGVVVLR